jgi:hypothetical protein
MIGKLEGGKIGEDAKGGAEGAQVGGGETGLTSGGSTAEGIDEAFGGSAQDLHLDGEVIPGDDPHAGELFGGKEAVVATGGGGEGHGRLEG